MGAWDGWASELMAGALSGVVVLGGIRWTQHLSDQSLKVKSRYEAAALLVEQISDVRDKSTRSGGRLSGHWALWPLRNRLMMSRHLFPANGPLSQIDDFVFSLNEYRAWLRRDMGGPQTDPEKDFALDISGEWERLLSGHADSLIRMLQGPMTALDVLGGAPPKCPNLPWWTASPDDV